MERSKNFNFYLPSRDSADIADINQISYNFMVVDENVPKKNEVVSILKDGSATLQTTGTTPNSITTKQYVDSEIQSNVDVNYSPTSAKAQSGIALEPMFNMKSNTDHVHEATEIRVDSHTPTLYGDSVQAALDYANKTLHEKADKQEVANALKGTASGSVLALNDVSPVEHTMGVKVRGKNLFDKSIPFNNWEVVGVGYSKLSITVPTGSQITASVLKKYGTDEKKGHMYVRISGKDYWLFHEGQAGLCKKSVTAISTDGIVDVIFTLISYNNFKDEFMVEINSEATDYTPYISDLTAVPEKQWQQVFSRYCEFAGSHPEFYYAPIYTTKTFDIVVGREYTLETSGGKQGPNGLKYTCTAVANSYGGYSINCNDIRVETCSEDYAQQMIAAGFPEYSEWIGKLRIAWVTATQHLVDFTLTIKEHAGDMTKAVKLIKTNADGTVSEEYTPTADGTVNGVTSLYPCTKLSTNVDGIVIECEYNRDINKAFEELQQAIISLGGTV